MDDISAADTAADVGPSGEWRLQRSPSFPAVTEKCWQAVVLARDAGASVKEIVECLWLDRADQERARLAVKRLKPGATQRDELDTGDALTKIAEIRVAEVLMPVWDRYFAAVWELNAAVDDMGRHEDSANRIITELAAVNQRLEALERVTLGVKSKPPLVKRAARLCEQLSEQFNQILVILERISDLLAEMTTYTDAGLLQAGYTVNEILALGASPRSARSVYRRQGLPGRTKPSTRIDNAFVEAFTDAVDVFTPMLTLHEEWTEIIRNRLAALQQCRHDIPSAVRSRSLAAVAQPIRS